MSGRRGTCSSPLRFRVLKATAQQCDCFSNSVDGRMFSSFSRTLSARCRRIVRVLAPRDRLVRRTCILFRWRSASPQSRSPGVFFPGCLVGLRPWRIKRRREVPCRIRNRHHRRNRSRCGQSRQLHARRQIERCNRRSQSIIRHRPRPVAHRTMVHARRAVPAFHLHRMMPAAARHRAFLRRTHLTSRHQRQRHRQQRQNQTHSLYPPHHFCSRIISAL